MQNFIATFLAEIMSLLCQLSLDGMFQKMGKHVWLLDQSQCFESFFASVTCTLGQVCWFFING